VEGVIQRHESVGQHHLWKDSRGNYTATIRWLEIRGPGGCSLASFAAALQTSTRISFSTCRKWEQGSSSCENVGYVWRSGCRVSRLVSVLWPPCHWMISLSGKKIVNFSCTFSCKAAGEGLRTVTEDTEICGVLTGVTIPRRLPETSLRAATGMCMVHVSNNRYQLWLSPLQLGNMTTTTVRCQL
jgi:hypothetical protein